jgi:hypothetical protein
VLLTYKVCAYPISKDPEERAEIEWVEGDLEPKYCQYCGGRLTTIRTEEGAG